MEDGPRMGTHCNPHNNQQSLLPQHLVHGLQCAKHVDPLSGWSLAMSFDGLCALIASLLGFERHRLVFGECFGDRMIMVVDAGFMVVIEGEWGRGVWVT